MMKQLIYIIIAFPILSCFTLFGKPLELTNLQENAQQTLPLDQDTLRIDIQQAIDIAMSESPVIKVSDMEIKKKKYIKKGVQGALFPQIDAIGKYSRTIKKQTMYMDEGFPMGGKKIDPSTLPPNVKEILDLMGMLGNSEEKNEEGIQFGRSNLWSAGIGVSMSLLVPELWKNISLTSLDVELAVEEAHSSKIDLANSVKRAFYSVLLGQEAYNVYKEMYDNETNELSNIEKKYKQGVVAEFDFITAQVRQQTIRPEMIQAENALSMSKLQLKAMMGIDIDLPIIVKGKLADYEEKMFSSLSTIGGVEGLLFGKEEDIDNFLENNSELKKLDIKAKQLHKMYEAKVAKFLPRIVAGFNWQYMSQNNDFKFKDYRLDPFSTAEITISIPLFSGGTRTYEARAAKISEEQLAVQRTDVEKKLKVAVQNQISEIVKSIEQINVLKTTENQAQRGYLIALKRYETGMGTLLEVNQASFASVNVRLQKSNSIFSYLVAKSELEKLLGENNFTND